MSNNEIHRITVDGFGGIRDMIEIEPDGRSLVLLTGKNRSGKTSALNAIIESLSPGGKKAVPFPVNVERDRAVTTIETTDWTSVVTHKPDGTRKVVVTPANGGLVKSGVAFLQDEIGLGFIDPSKFALMNEKDQRAMLLDMIELPFDLATKEGEIRDAETERTRLNTVAKTSAGAFGAMTRPETGLPTEEVSLRGLTEEYQAALASNRELTDLENEEKTVQHARDDIARQIAELQELDREKAARLEEIEEALLELSYIDLDPLTERMDSIGETNAKIRDAAAYKEARAKSEADKTAAEAAQAEVDRLRKEKTDAVNGAEFPIEGLSVDDDGILLHGLPFTSNNAAERTIVSFLIQAALQPKLRFAVISNGENLDNENVERLATAAEERGFFVLAERGRDPQEFAEISYTFSQGEIQ